jgi:predicted enzyme related to lactoylglutathione lyase
MTNAVVQWQFLARDPDAVSGFYSTLFGWSVDRHNQLGYRRLQSGGDRGIDGGVWPTPPESPSFVQLFIAVDDVAACASKAVDLGAKILVPAQKLPDGDEMSILLGPEGVSFGIIKQKGGAGG